MNGFLTFLLNIVKFIHNEEYCADFLCVIL